MFKYVYIDESGDLGKYGSKYITVPAGTKTRISRCTGQQVLPVNISKYRYNLNLSVTLKIKRII